MSKLHDQKAKVNFIFGGISIIVIPDIPLSMF
jgi:hypothetical protein